MRSYNRFTSRLRGLLLLPVLLSFLLPSIASALEFYVDAATGLDTRSTVEAQSAQTPWKSIQRALQLVQPGNAINVAPGTYAESAQSSFANVTLRATGAANSVIVAPPNDPDDKPQVGILVSHPGLLIEGIVIVGGSHGIKATAADGLRIRGCKAIAQTFNGFTVEHTSGVTIESSVAASAGSRGIFLDHTSEAYLRSNLVYAAGEWGIDFDNTNASDPQPPVSMGNVVAFNTVAYNGNAAGEGGLRLKNAVGQIRDNVIVSNATTGLRLDTTGSVVKNTLLFDNATPVSPDTYVLGGGMLAVDPLLVDPDGADGILGGVTGWADDVFALSQVAAGQGADSPAVDTGSGNASALDIGGSTRSDAVADTGVANLGFHSGAPASTGVPAVTSGPATYYVNAATGSDARTKLQAQSPSTPWQSIGRALSPTGAATNDTVRVASGTYGEAVTTTTGGITLRATGAAIVAPPAGLVGITVNHPGVLVEGFDFQGGLQAIKADGADGLTVRDCTMSSQTGSAIAVSDTAGVTIDGNAIDGPAGRGVLVERSTMVQITGNEVTNAGEWGIQLDASGLAAASTGNLISDNTIADPGRVNPAGAIDLVFSTGVVSDVTTSGGQHGVRASLADGLVVRSATITSPGSNGIYLIDSSGVLVDDNVVRDAGARGIYLERTGDAYVRNNLVARSGEWGVQLNSANAPLALDNVIAFNTVVGNGIDPGSIDGGIRLQNAIGEVRDNIVANNDAKGIKVDRGVYVHHNDVVGSTTPYEQDNDNPPIYAANLAVDPLFANAGAGDFRLQAGSPVIDHGSGSVAALDISGATRADGTPDTGTADMGRHEDATASSGTPPSPAPTPTPTPGPTPTPPPGGGAVHYVDCATGDDARSKTAAQNPSTPWRTLQKAASTLAFGDVAVVANGVCDLGATSVSVDRAGITLRAAQPLGTTVRRSSGTGTAINVSKNDVTLEGFVVESPTSGLLAAPSSGTLSNLVLRRLLVQPLAATMTTNGMQVRDAQDVTIEDCIVTGATQNGILLKRVGNAYVRNNLVYANAVGTTDWGISFDNTNTTNPPVSTGNIAAFNTLYGNGRGLRFVNTAGEIRDNVVAMNGAVGIKFDQPGLASLVHHNDAFGQTTNYDAPSGFQLWASNKSVDPLFVDAPNGDFALSQIVAGQVLQSPLVDEGSGPVDEVDIAGTTQSGGSPQPDTGLADMGFHSDADSMSGPGGPSPTPAPTSPTYYVDCTSGDDAASKWEAQFSWSAWRTIGFALAQAVAGDTIVVQPGDCNEAVTMSTASVTLRAAVRGATTVRPPAGATAFTLRADATVLDGFVARSDKEGVLVAKEASGTKIEDVVVRQLRIRARTPNGKIATNGVRVRDGQNVIVDSNVVTDTTQSGIVFDRGKRNYARNNLVIAAGEWGIHFDNGTGTGASGNNIAAFNTVHQTGKTAAQGGIRFQKASGEIRDNLAIASPGIGIKTDTQPTYVHHNGLFGNTTALSTDAAAPPVVWSNVELDPLFVALGATGFQLQQLAAGQAADSPMIDRGSGAPATRDISGSTRTDGMPDAGNADIGYHAGAAASTGRPAIQAPPSGTTYHVDAQAGSDTRSATDALDPATPWKTIARALAANGAPSGSTVEVATGTYAEAPKSSQPSLTLRASGTVIITPPSGQIGLTIDHAGFVVDGFTIQGGLHGIRGTAANGLIVRNCTATGQSDNALYVVDTTGFTLDGNTTRDAGKRGILVERSTQAYVRNNLLRDSGEWGVELKNATLPTPSSGNVIAFNTIVGSGRVLTAGAIRFDNSTGEIRDNVLADNTSVGIATDTAPTLVHHNLIDGSALELDTASGQEPTTWANVLGQAPLFVDAPGGNFRLQQVAAGQASNSPGVDAGSGDPASRDISGTTRSDAVADTGTADLGRHADANPAAATPPAMSTPPNGNPTPGSGPTYYVDPVTGSDARSLVQARSASTPWKTIAHAMTQVSAGETIALTPGTYAEQADFSAHALTLRGLGSLGQVVIAPPTGAAGVNVDSFADGRIENVVVQGGSIGIAGMMADRLRVRGVAVVNPATVGIRVRQTNTVWIDSSIVTGGVNYGILLQRTKNSYVRNNLVYANPGWGISLDADGSTTAPGNVLAFNTIHQNGSGVRLLNASGEVRDNDFTETVDLALYLAGPNISVHHNNFSANGRDRDKASAFAGSIVVWSNLGANPRYEEPAGLDGILGGSGWADDDFRLEQFASGGEFDSPVANAGSGQVASLDIGGTTRKDGVPDAGVADIGFHYGAPAAVAAPAPAPTPTTFTYTYYVAKSSGDDTRTDATARNAATPWKTITKALQRVTAGDTIVVLPSSDAYAESLQVVDADVTLMAQTPGTVTITPPITPPSSKNKGISIAATGVTVDGFVVRGASTGIAAEAGASSVTVRNCAVIGATMDAFRAFSLDGVTFENDIAAGAGGAGFALRKATSATVRNNLAYDNAEWGIHLDNTPVGSEVVAVSTGNLVAGNTAAFNGTGNIRLANAIGDVRDNVIANTGGTGLAITTAGARLVQNGFYAANTLLDPASYVFCSGCTGNVVRDPRFVNPAGNDALRGGDGWADDDFRLAQIAAGQSPQSEAVDFGSASVAALGITGSTATNGAADAGIADLGFHYS
ncbi:right-handed parallel beta-helix repeat-containing protein, partial [Candidatus Binatia bacterium]|nr:right-handed parallel beta-helix repeat-containing protein [Candidatus Binatia bacterium]